MTTIKAEDYKVSGNFLRGFLAALRRVNSAEYVRFLQAAGLERFATRYPPANLETVAKGSEFIKLLEVVRQNFNAGFYRLFMRNLGRELGTVYSDYLHLETTVAGLDQFSASTPLIELIPAVVGLNYQVISESITIEEGTDPNMVYLTYTDCIYCAEHPKTDQPVCAMLNAFYRTLLNRITGNEYYIQEIECGAITGTRNCRFLLHQTNQT